MSITIARLVAEVGADTREFDAGMRTVERTAQTTSERANKSMGIIGEGVRQVGSSLRAAAVGGVAFVAGMAVLDRVGDVFSFVGESAIGMNDRLQQARIGFTTMLGSAQAADAHLKRMADFAARTPFEFPGLVETSQRMLALGFSSQQVVPLLTAVGNAAAALGSGQTGIDRITTALGQMQARTRVSADEMLQLTEAGIPAWQLLADAMGLSVAQTQKLVEQGKVAAPVFIEAFEAFSKAKYGDMMGQQAKTYRGAMSTIIDASQMAIAEGAKPLFDRFTKGAVEMAEFTQSAEFDTWSTRTANALDKVLVGLDGLGAAAARVDAKLQDLTGRGLAETVARAVPGFSQLATVFDALSTGTQEWGEHGGMLRESLDDAKASAEALGGAVGKAGKQVVDAWSEVRGQDLLGLAGGFADLLKPEEVAKSAAALSAAFTDAAAQASRRLVEVNTEAAEAVAAATEARDERVATAERDAAERMAEAVADTGKRLADAQRDAADAHQAALLNHTERVVEAQEQASLARTAAFAREGERMNKALDDSNTATRQAIADAAERELDLRAETARRIGDAQADAAEKVRVAQERYAETTAEAVRDAGERILDTQHDSAQRLADALEGREQSRRERHARDVFDATADQADRERRQSREDAEARYQYERDLAEAADEEERARIEARFTRAEADRTRRRALDEEDRAWAAEQEKQRRTFEDRLAEDAFQRLLARLSAEGVARERAIEEELAKRLTAQQAQFAREVQANRRALAERVADERAALDRSLADSAETLEKRRQQIAERRAAEMTEAAKDREQRLAEVNAALVRELDDHDKQLQKKQAAIEAQLLRERESLAAALSEKQADIAKAYADDVAEADRALVKKLADVGKRADEERDKIRQSLYDRERDLWDFIDRIPAGSDIKTDNFVDAMWRKLENVRLTALAADEAIRRIAAAPVATPAYPGQTPQPTAGAGHFIDGVWYPAASRDTGGSGMAGRPYAIGVPEIFVPDTPGRFYPLGGAQVGGGYPESITIPVEIDGERMATIVLRAQDFNRARLAGVGS